MSISGFRQTICLASNNLHIFEHIMCQDRLLANERKNKMHLELLVVSIVILRSKLPCMC